MDLIDWLGVSGFFSATIIPALIWVGRIGTKTNRNEKDISLLVGKLDVVIHTTSEIKGKTDIIIRTLNGKK